MAPKTRNMQKCKDREKNKENKAEGEPVPPLQPQETEVERNEEVHVEAENPNLVQTSAIAEDGAGEVGEQEMEEEADVGENATLLEGNEIEVNEDPIDPRIENETPGNVNDDEGSSRSSSRTVSEPIDPPIDPPIDRQIESEDEEIEALQPLGMYFPPTEYSKKIKISTRCFINEVVKTFKEVKLTTREKKWFEEHPQFKHIFHMPKDNNHKVMGIWLLLLRTARIDRKKEAWFVVNGVPIRYGIKEHALISGLNCKNYPLGYKEKGSLRFVRKYITRSVIRLQDVRKALVDMVPRKGNDDRLKMAVLYFLASIIRGQTKCGEDATGVEEVLLRAVEDLTYCETFPWGRLSFDHMLMEIAHTMSHFGGKVNKKGPWPIPGFCIPLELLAFEAISGLNSSFREVVPEADRSCPRMCKSKFRKSYLKGFPLSEINEQLGDTKVIDSIIAVREEEHDLMREILEEEDVDDVHDYIINTWMGRLSRGKTVFFEEMYNEDVDSRVEKEIEEGENHAKGGMDGLVDLVNAMRAEIDERFNTIEEKIGGLEERITPLEAYVKNKQGRQGNSTEESDEDSVPNSPQPRDDNPETSGGADEERLAVVFAQERSKIKSTKRSRDPNTPKSGYPRKPVTRSNKPRLV